MTTLKLIQVLTVYTRRPHCLTSQFRGRQTPLVGSDVFVHYLSIFFVVAVDGVSMVTVARSDRCVFERNIQGTVDGFKGAMVNVVGYAHLRCVTAQILDAVVRLLEHNHYHTR